MYDTEENFTGNLHRQFYLGDEKHDYIPDKANACGGRDKSTVLMHLLHLTRANPKPDFFTYKQLMRLDTAQALANPDSLARFAQGKWLASLSLQAFPLTKA